VLFTYGDLLNDAQQFQFGFSNGLRAIGNNIGFAAEGISNLSTNAGGLRGALKALGSSLIGPGGLILAINLAVTAFTVFGDKLLGARQEAKMTKEELDGLTEVIEGTASALEARGFFGEDPFGIKELRFQQEAIRGAIEETVRGQERLTLSKEEENRLTRLQVDLSLAQANNNQSRVNAIEREISLLEGQVANRKELARIEQQLREDLQGVTDELRKQQLIQEQVNRLIRQEGPGRAGEGGFISAALAGGGTLTAEQQRQAQQRRQQRQQEEQRIAGSVQRIQDMYAQAAGNIDELALRGIEVTEQKARVSAQTITSTLEAASMAVAAFFGESKAAAIADAIVQGTLAVQRALASAPPPFNFALAATVGAATAANIAKIASTDIGSTGGGAAAATGGGGSSRQFIGEGRFGANRQTTQRRAADMVTGQNVSDRIAVQVVNTFDEKTAAFAVRRGEANIRRTQQ